MAVPKRERSGVSASKQESDSGAAGPVKAQAVMAAVSSDSLNMQGRAEEAGGH